jgi:hypothetical protein
MLTNREIATLILLTALVIWVFVMPSVRSSVIEVVKVFFSRQVVLINLTYLGYAAVVVYVASLLRAWDVGLLKDTVVILLVVGYPMVFRANEVKNGEVLFRRTIRKTLAVSAFVIFYVNLNSLPIIWEVVIQIVVTFVAMSSFAAKTQGTEFRSVLIFFNLILGGIGLFLFATTTIDFINHWKQENFQGILRTFAMTIWLPLSLLPLIYVGAFLMQYQTILVMLPFNNGRKNTPFSVKLALLLGLHGSVHFASNLIGFWRQRLGGTESYREARLVMAEYRTETKRMS